MSKPHPIVWIDVPENFPQEGDASPADPAIVTVLAGIEAVLSTGRPITLALPDGVELIIASLPPVQEVA